MKKIYTLIIITALFASCGQKKEQSVDQVLASNDLNEIRTKKSELDKKQQELAAQLKLLNDKIFELDKDKKIPLVSTFKVQNQKFTHYLELQGSVQTKQNVLISPEMSGLLKEVYVKEGQHVTQGQVLAKIDDGGISNQLAQLEAQAQLAKTTYERQKRLWGQKIGSEIQYLQTKTNYEAQKNAVEQLKKTLAKSTIKAPFSGVIDDVIIEQGTIVSPGAGVFRIVNLSNMYIETDVPENYISSIKKGKEVEVNFPILNENIHTKIRQAGNFINPANRTFKVEIFIPNKKKNIKPNLTAKLKINDYTNTDAILIPQSIISENASGKQYIFVVNNIKKEGKTLRGTAKKVTITTGKTQGDIVEVLSGLKNGQQIIKEGARSVKDGQVVSISQS